MASLVLGAETPSQSVCVCVAGREGGCWDRQLRVPGPSPQSKEVGPSPRTTEKQISPLSLLLQKVISPAQSLPPPLPFSEPGTPPHFHRSVRVPDNSSRDRDVEPGPKRECFTSDLSLPSSARTPAPPGAIRSDPIPLGQIARPPPPLTWAGLLRDRRDTGSQTGSTQLTAPGPGSIYGCPHPLLPVLRNFWKVGNASGERRGSQKEKKCQRPPPNRPGSRPCACGPLSQPLGPTAPSTDWVGGLAS